MVLTIETWLGRQSPHEPKPKSVSSPARQFEIQVEANEMDLVKLGNKIKRARIEAGLTQREAAIQADVCRATIIALEQGKTVPRYDKMVKLAKLLRVESKE